MAICAEDQSKSITFVSAWQMLWPPGDPFPNRENRNLPWICIGNFLFTSKDGPQNGSVLQRIQKHFNIILLCYYNMVKHIRQYRMKWFGNILWANCIIVKVFTNMKSSGCSSAQCWRNSVIAVRMNGPIEFDQCTKGFYFSLCSFFVNVIYCTLPAGTVNILH